MVESYLLVPTNGLPADKALALAQFIRFAVGSTGQADITALGAAPATPAMVTADLAVAQQLDAEAGVGHLHDVTRRHHHHNRLRCHNHDHCGGARRHGHRRLARFDNQSRIIVGRTGRDG